MMSDRTWRVVVAVSLAVAAVALVLFITVDGSDDEPVTVQAVEQLIPGRGDQAIRQARVGIDLTAGHTGVLVINGIEIPEDQLERVEPLNQIYFQPGEDKEIEAFEPGEVCVVAIYWQIGQDREGGERVRWCFDVA
jgi:hypothetical protein